MQTSASRLPRAADSMRATLILKLLIGSLGLSPRRPAIDLNCRDPSLRMEASEQKHGDKHKCRNRQRKVDCLCEETSTSKVFGHDCLHIPSVIAGPVGYGAWERIYEDSIKINSNCKSTERPPRRWASTRMTPWEISLHCSKAKPRRHSITSSARASSIAGTSRPSALAVLRLITSSYLVGACTGRSAGFSPLRMRST